MPWSGLSKSKAMTFAEVGQGASKLRDSGSDASAPKSALQTRSCNELLDSSNRYSPSATIFESQPVGSH